MSDNSSAIISKVWGMCGPLRDDGVSYGDYLEQLTYLIFLKMSDEYSKPPYKKETGIPEGFGWSDMNTLTGAELENQYKATLEKLGEQGGILGTIFKGAINKVSNAAILYRIVQMIDKEKWVSMSSDVKGEIYEGLLQKNAEDVKSGAGQYFTPRPVIKAMVKCMRPEPMKTIADPCCGSGGFFLAAQEFIVNQDNYVLDREQKEFLKNQTFYGNELVATTFKMALMNLYLHNIGDIYGNVPIAQGDSLLTDPRYRVDYVLTNPPFGKKSSLTFTNEEGEQEEEDLVYNRQDFWTTSSNKQLNFIQHINTLLKATGKAAVVVPDNVLFEGGAGEIIRKKLLHTTDLHTILRLPTGIFYKPGVKANVIFFDKRPANAEMQTKEVWIYDFRTNIHFTLKQNPMTDKDLEDFIACYNPENRYERKETYSLENPEGRWRKFDVKDILERDKTSLDIFWIKDKSLADLENLPSPDELADDIIENLESALDSFRELNAQLKRNSNKCRVEYECLNDEYSPRKMLIEEIIKNYEIPIEQAYGLTSFLESSGFIEIKYSDTLVHGAYDNYYSYLTVKSEGELSSINYNPYNIVINWKADPMGALPSFVTSALATITGIEGDITLSAVMALLSTVFSAFSLGKISFNESETAIILVLHKHALEECKCYDEANKMLVEYGYIPMTNPEFNRAINKLIDCRCVSIIDGVVELIEVIRT